MTSSSKLDDVPVVHSVYVYSDDYQENEIFVKDIYSELISRKLKKTTGKSVKDICKEVYAQCEINTIHEYQCGKSTYVLYVLQASSSEKSVFVCNKKDPFLKEYSSIQETIFDNSLRILPFLDGALSRFLQRSEIYGVEASPMHSPKKGMSTNLKTVKNGRTSRCATVTCTFVCSKI